MEQNLPDLIWFGTRVLTFGIVFLSMNMASRVLKIKDVISFLLVNVIPLCIMIPSNIAILVKLYRRYTKRRELGASNLNENERVKMTVMLSSVTVVYIVLQSPLTIYTLLYGMKLGKIMFVFRSLEILNGSLNFYLYFMSAKLFREKVFEMLGCCQGEERGKNNIRRQRQRFRQARQWDRQGDTVKKQVYSIEIEVPQSVATEAQVNSIDEDGHNHSVDFKAWVHTLGKEVQDMSAQGLSEENLPQGPLENQLVDIKAQVSSVGEDSHGHSVGTDCGSPPGVMMADTLSFNAKIGVVNF